MESRSIAQRDFIARLIFKDVYTDIEITLVFCTYLHFNSNSRVIGLYTHYLLIRCMHV